MGRVLVQQPGTTTAKALSETLPKNVIIVDEDLHQLRLHDGITPGGHVIGGSGGGNNSNALLSFMWADHQLNDVSWLRADTFSWQSGDVYVAAYEHLAADLGDSVSYIESSKTNPGHKFVRAPEQDDNSAEHPFAWYDKLNNASIYTNNETPVIGETIYLMSTGSLDSGTVKVYGQTYSGASEQTETIGDITITYYLSDDGHKICLPDQESNLVSLYNKTGVAWYYILDTTNRQFKLPRTKWGFTGIRNGVGEYVAPGLPNITGQSNVWGSNSESGALKTTITGTAGLGSSIYSVIGNIGLDASKSNAIYGNSTTVQPPATQMYLYFYVGNFEQSAIEQTAGLNAELFNNKADLNLMNITANVDFVIESQMPTAGNGYTWYRKYKSGWVEQGGIKLQNTDSKQDLSLPIEMNGATYSVLTSVMDDNLTNFVFCVKVTDKTTTGFKTTVWGSYQQGISTRGYNFVWQVSGMSAQ